MEVQALDMRALENALDCLRQGLPLDNLHPLSHFISLRTHLPFYIDNGLARDYLIFSGLCRVIRRELKRQRSRCTPEYATTKTLPPEEILKQDFQQSNRELEAWSLLYYRFVRVDLDLSLEQISVVVGQTMRTLNRRQHLGLTRLLHALVRRETKAIRLEHQAYLRACLPLPVASALYGRKAYLEWSVEYLATNMPGHLCISGRPGVGKTTFAIRVADSLIEQCPLHKIIWLDQPTANLDWLTGTVGKNLGLAESDLLNLSAHLHTHPVLIVMDEASALLQDDSLLATIQQVFGRAYLIVIANKQPSFTPRMGYIELPALDKNVCLEWLMSQTFVPERKQRQFMDRFDGVFNQFGGNLKSLRYELCRLAI